MIYLFPIKTFMISIQILLSQKSYAMHLLFKTQSKENNDDLHLFIKKIEITFINKYVVDLKI